MLSALFALALIAGQVDTPPAPGAGPPRASTMPPAASGAWTASDEEINRGLLAAFRQDPTRRVCATYTSTGSTQPRSVCGTLQSWFNQRTQGEINGRRAPHVLIEEIKERRAQARTQAAR